jgi:phosphoglycolate phosphatase
MSGPLIVFDVDGTLLDSQNAIVHCMEQAFDSIGLPRPTRAETLAIVGLSLPEVMRTLAPAADAATQAAAVLAYKAAFVALRARDGGEAASPLYPGARAALDRLAAVPGLRLGLATGKARRGLDHFVAAHGLGGHFVTTHCADEHPSKPDPSMLLGALARTGARAGQAVMVGDTTFDIRMGRAAGFATIGVAWGYHPVGALLEAGADRIIDGFDALDAALAELAPA